MKSGSKVVLLIFIVIAGAFAAGLYVLRVLSQTGWPFE